MRRILMLAAAVVVLVEVGLLWLVGHYIGAVPTFLLVVLSTAIGLALVRREGARAWHALRSTVSAGGNPDSQLVDGALVLAGGALMVLPGFLTDVVGLALLTPPVRRLARGPIARSAVGWAGGPRRVRSRRTGTSRPYVPADRTPTGAPRVIDATVVDERTD